MRYFIYVIDNTINDKLYVGITNNPAARWRGHRKDSLTSMRLLYKAMRKYGVENFEMVLLETVKTKDEAKAREIFWIDHLKTHCKQNGYNMTFGGDSGGAIGTKNAKAILTEEEVVTIYELSKTSETFVSISRQFNISESTVAAIAKGKIWVEVTGHSGSEPKRRRVKSPLTEQDVIDIYTMTQNGVNRLLISKQFNVTKGTVSNIARGISWSVVTGHEVNTRERLTATLVLAIFNAEGSMACIADHYNVSAGTIGHIKNGNTWSHVTGKIYKQTHDAGSVGTDNGNSKLTEQDVIDIYNWSQNNGNETITEIADRYGVTGTAISRIAYGGAWKHITCHEPKNTKKLGGRGIYGKSSKLTVEQVLAIYNSATNTSETYQNIGKRFGVCESSVRQIANRVTWRKVTEHLDQGPPLSEGP